MMPPRYTRDEAVEAHRLHQKGVENEWVREGERQYQREAKRDERARKQSVA